MLDSVTFLKQRFSVLQFPARTARAERHKGQWRETFEDNLVQECNRMIPDKETKNERERVRHLASNLYLTCLSSLHSLLSFLPPSFFPFSLIPPSPHSDPSLSLLLPLLVSTPYPTSPHSHWSSIHQSQQNRSPGDCICKTLLNIHELLSGL